MIDLPEIEKEDLILYFTIVAAFYAFVSQENAANATYQARRAERKIDQLVLAVEDHHEATEDADAENRESMVDEADAGEDDDGMGEGFRYEGDVEDGVLTVEHVDASHPENDYEESQALPVLRLPKEQALAYRDTIDDALQEADES